MSNKITGKAVYNMALPIVDYIGKADKGSELYSEYYSPNNLRRLIIAPDVVLGVYYIKVPNIGQTKVIRVPSELYTACCVMNDYTPVVRIIAGERICSSIEEIVFLTMSSDGKYQLQARDYDINILTSSFKSTSDDAIDVLRRRFVRLRYITRMNISYAQFQQIDIKLDKFVAESLEGYCQSVIVHDEVDWYKNYGSAAAAKAYPKMDGADGHLTQYFKKYIDECNKDAKAGKLRASKDRRYKQIYEEFEKAYKEFRFINEMHKRLVSLFKNQGTSATFGDGEVRFVKVTLPELWNIEWVAPSYPRLKDSEGNLEKEYRENIDACREGIKNIIVATCATYWNAINDAHLSKAVISLIETDILAPKGVELPVGVQSTNQNMKSSFSMACAWLCRLFLNRNGIAVDLYDKRRWEV